MMSKSFAPGGVPNPAAAERQRLRELKHERANVEGKHSPGARRRRRRRPGYSRGRGRGVTTDGVARVANVDSVGRGSVGRDSVGRDSVGRANVGRGSCVGRDSCCCWAPGGHRGRGS